MALSEHEQRILQQLEMQFKEEDSPKLNDSNDAESAPRRSAFWIFIGLLTAMAGMGTLLLAISLNQTIAGIAVGLMGFTALIAGGYVATKRREPRNRLFQRRRKNTQTSDEEAAPGKDHRSFKDNAADAAFWALFWWD